MSDPQAAHPSIRLSAAAYRQIREWAAAGYPHEVCGLLLGRTDPRATRVGLATQARNLATERLADRYTLDPDDFLAADTRARQAGIEVVGIWHTHPDHPARPSATDLAAAWEGYAYLILSVQAGSVVDATSWQLRDGAFVRQPIEEEA